MTPAKPETGTLTRRIDGTNATALHVGEGAKGAILIHGFASDRREMGPLPETLAEHGFQVVAPDLRGHGESAGERGVLSRKRVLEDLSTWRDALEEHGADVSLLVGHSLGGLWALYAQPELEADAVGALCSPVSIRSELTRAEHVAYRAGGLLNRGLQAAGSKGLRVPYKVSLEDVLDHPRAIEKARGLGLLQDSIPLAIVSELLAIDGEAWARAVDVPALVGHGVRDAFIPRESTHRVFEALSGEKTWMELPGPHSVFLDVEADECARRVSEWAVDTLR